MSALGNAIHRIRAFLRSDMLVLRWVLLALYLLVVGGLVSFLLRSGDNDERISVLVATAILLGSQALFILGGGTIKLCRPIRKARLWMPVLVASLMLGVLVIGFAMAMTELIYGGKPDPPWLGPFLLWMIGGSWLVWTALFWVYTRGQRRMRALSRLTTILFAGSLAELLACAPAHVIVSRRHYCLAGISTMIGIVAGLGVMLFSFGPAIILLFLRPRYRREQMEDTLCPKCEYDLRGTLAAGRTQCPECGMAIGANSSAPLR